MARVREKNLLIAGVVVAIVTVSAAAALGMLQLRESATARVQGATQNLATSLTQTMDGLFDMIDVSLLASGDEISRQNASHKPDTAAINRYLELQARRLPHVAYLRGTDEKGDVVYGPNLPVQRANLAEREFFTTLRSQSEYGLFLAKPVIAKIARKPVLTLARRIERADGSFAGTVYASIYVDEIQKMLGDIKMEPGGSLAMRDRDLGLIARQTFGAKDTIPMGSRKMSAPFEVVAKQNPASGTYTSDATSVDPMVRTYSYVRSDKYGYLVNVGIPVEVELTQWLHQVWMVVGLVAIFAFALMALAWQVTRSRARLESLVANLHSSREALQQNHKLLVSAEAEQRGLLEKLHTAVIVHAPDSQITFSNHRAAELLGLTEDQMRGKTAIDPAWCFVDETRNPIAPPDYPVSRVLATRKPLSEMTLGVKVPGRRWLVWLLVSAFPEFEADGALKQVVVNFYDVTRLREADERWRFALEGAGDGVWDLNVETNEAIYSKRYQEMLGYAEGEVPGTHQGWVDRVHPEDLQRVLALQEEQQNDPSGIFSSEYRLRCKDGTYKWIYARGMAVSRGADGQILRIVGTHTDISQMKAAESKIWSQANFDALTQLPNRRLFYDRLEMKIRKAHREEELIALLFIDLDHFKEVNDTLGHHVGDKLLIEAARRIKEAVRDYDTVARLGGDEFTVILAEQSELSDIGSVAEKVIERLSEPFLLGEQETYVSASVGIALYPNDAHSLNDLVKNADQAMYAAKTAGRKCFRFFTKSMQESAISRMALVNDLRRATVAQQFEVYYQPIIDLRTGDIFKAEALVRWHHPTRGMVSPAEFIPLAEDIGAIHDIGDWVFQQSAQQVALWQKRYNPAFQVSVNKSPVQFSGNSRGHASWIDGLKTYGIDGSSIVIEITEGVLMDSNAKVAQSLIQFRDAGIQVAIDDFGTGYSSLSYLKKFDIDYLKIDQSFTRNLEPESADFALCEAIIVMAHKLGLKVIAEGVETAQQRDLLNQVGCDFGQGYLFSRPLPVQAFEALMNARKALAA
jgi:diguanylate cyclase (GGDEF)-like protein/PAS domain S-box-containing protein